MSITTGALLAGRYRAEELLGHGGMGEVWRCHDVEQGTDVAVKAVHTKYLNDPQIARLFYDEVIASARLNHPGIVPVYDFIRGEDGTALLVMAYRRGQPLASFVSKAPPWVFIAAVLTQILEALAYAHARGILHLDVKPENVIVERRGSALLVTLVDFGLARWRRPGRGVRRWMERDVVVGTIGYMAPEQCAGSIERFGPWTDLYSVGTMAFELCTGKRPFPDAAYLPALIRRMGDTAPPLVPGIAGVPDGFVDLCACLLATEPRDRPSHAADVLYRLRDLAPPTSLRPNAARNGPISQATSWAAPPSAAPDTQLSALSRLDGGEAPWTERDPVITSFDIDDDPTISGDPDPELTFADGAAEDRNGAITAVSGAPSMSVSRELIETIIQEIESEPVVTPAEPRTARISIGPWRVQDVELAFNADRSPHYSGAYGLFGLRDLPVLGRLEERRAVWNAVHATVIHRRMAVVVLEGPAGVGKSRVARDAMERAVELGLCVALQTSWSHEGSGDEGLRGLIENMLDTRGAAAPQLRARLAFWLERLDGEHSTFAREVELLLRPPPGAAPDARMPLRVAVDAITKSTALRPVLLWLDDIQWSRGEALDLLRALAERSPALDVCVIATCRAEDVDDQDDYEELLRATGAARVRMDALDMEATRKLVWGLLEVDEELCNVLAARAEGNPLFVTQLLRELVSTEAVERRDGRYRLARAFDLSRMPVDMGAVWERRVAQSGAGRRELSALALVRERVSREVADELRRLLGAPFDAALKRALSTGLVHVQGGAYVWEHGLLREYLLQSLEPGTGPALHAVAAEALALLIGREDVQEERARHLSRAHDRARDACEAMLDAGLWSWRRADTGPRRARFEALVMWSQEMGFAYFEARGRAELAYLDIETGEAERANEGITEAKLLLEEVESVRRTARSRPGSTNGHTETPSGPFAPRAPGASPVADLASWAASWVALRHSQVARHQGRSEEGERMTEEALRIARTAGVVEVEALALLQLGLDRCRRREDAPARELLNKAAELCRESGDWAGEAQALRTLTHIEEPEQALSLIERSIELARAAGALRVELIGKQVWVDLLWRTGERVAARREAGLLVEDAARRSLRQTVSLLELQRASWAATEADWKELRAHRDQAVQWGATTGAIVERVAVCALDVLLAVVAGDDVAAIAAMDTLDRTRGTFDDAVVRDLLARAAMLASPAIAARIRGELRQSSSIS